MDQPLRMAGESMWLEPQPRCRPKVYSALMGACICKSSRVLLYLPERGILTEATYCRPSDYVRSACAVVAEIAYEAGTYHETCGVTPHNTIGIAMYLATTSPLYAVGTAGWRPNISRICSVELTVHVAPVATQCVGITLLAKLDKLCVNLHMPSKPLATNRSCFK
jgi:hypothetical protein